MESCMNEREVYAVNCEKDKKAVQQQCAFLSENSTLFNHYLDELIDLSTGLPMYQNEYPDETFFEEQGFVYDLFFSLLDALQDCGIGIFLPEFLKSKLRSLKR